MGGKMKDFGSIFGRKCDKKTRQKPSKEKGRTREGPFSENGWSQGVITISDPPLWVVPGHWGE